MTGAAVRAQMTHRATVERNMQADANADGHLGPPDWQPLGSTLACFVYLRTGNGREAVSPERTVGVDSLALLAPLGSDLTIRDRINGIQDRAGSSIVSGLLNVRSVLRHHDHIEVALERAS